MNISNQVKIALLAIVTLVLAILGYNFLKGRDLFSTKKMYYAKFKDIGELTVASPVKIKGLIVGSVASIQEANENVNEIIVGISMKRDVRIANTSEAFINTTVLGVSAIEIKLDKGTAYYKYNDTINSNSNPKLLEELQQKINPVLGNVNKSLGSLDSLLLNVNSVLNNDAKGNINTTLANLTVLTTQLTKSAAALQNLLNSQTGTIANSLKNVEKFSDNLNKNNEGINNIVKNLEKTTDKFSKMQLNETVTNLNTTVTELQTTLKGVNNPNGSIGKLLNDRLLYDRLNNTVKSVNTLIDDLKTHPKRYVSISVFGKKNKGNALTEPIINADSTINK